MITLAGDIGGTKVHLALFNRGRRDWLVDEKFRSSHYHSLEEIVISFLSKHQRKVDRACFGVAGLVQGKHSNATNLPWTIESDNLARVIGIGQVDLLNDLEANAYGINWLSSEEFLLINAGKEIQGNAALISAGTGLGEAGIYWDGKKHRPFACEGGHTSYAPENDQEIELLHYLRSRFEHVSYERLLSGAGLFSLYRFLIDHLGEKENREVSIAENPAKAISKLGLEKKCRTCEHALDWFIEIFGSEGGNLCLKMLAVGGLYIGGGIAPKIAPLFISGKFMKRMIAKGRFSSLLTQIPVKLILNENTALLGAAYYVS